MREGRGERQGPPLHLGALPIKWHHTPHSFSPSPQTHLVEGEEVNGLKVEARLHTIEEQYTCGSQQPQRFISVVCSHMCPHKRTASWC